MKNITIEQKAFVQAKLTNITTQLGAIKMLYELEATNKDEAYNLADSLEEKLMQYFSEGVRSNIQRAQKRARREFIERPNN